MNMLDFVRLTGALYHKNSINIIYIIQARRRTGQIFFKKPLTN